MHSVGTPGMWAAFIVLVIVAVIVDLMVLRSNGPHKVSAREALLWSLAWVALAAVFNLGLWWYLQGQMSAAQAEQVALEFLTGYLVEKALAVDNIFVFLMLFSYFKVQPEYQQRALILGVIGAIVLRAIMILIGAALIAKFNWILYVFGLFLMITGAKMLWATGNESDLKENPILGLINRHLPLTR